MITDKRTMNITMAHQVVVTEEHYVFRAETKRTLFILLAVGVALFIAGLFIAKSGGHHEAGSSEHASMQSSELVASVQQHAAASEGHAEAGHEGTSPWLKRIYYNVSG